MDHTHVPHLPPERSSFRCGDEGRVDWPDFRSPRLIGCCSVTPEVLDLVGPPASHAACLQLSDGHDGTLFDVADLLGCELDAIPRYVMGIRRAAQRRVFDEDGDPSMGLAGPPADYPEEIRTLVLSTAQQLGVARTVIAASTERHRVALDALLDDQLIDAQTFGAARVALLGSMGDAASSVQP